jgi:hypothetical protein
LLAIRSQPIGVAAREMTQVTRDSPCFAMTSSCLSIGQSSTNRLARIGILSLQEASKLVKPLGIMSQDIVQIIARIEAAIARIQAAAADVNGQPASTSTENALAERHAQLIASTQEAIRAIDGVLLQAPGVSS